MRYALVVGLVVVCAALAGCTADESSTEATQTPPEACGPEATSAESDLPSQPEDVDQPPGCP